MVDFWGCVGVGQPCSDPLIMRLPVWGLLFGLGIVHFVCFLVPPLGCSVNRI